MMNLKRQRLNSTSRFKGRRGGGQYKEEEKIFIQKMCHRGGLEMPKSAWRSIRTLPQQKISSFSCLMLFMSKCCIQHYDGHKITRKSRHEFSWNSCWNVKYIIEERNVKESRFKRVWVIFFSLKQLRENYFRTKNGWPHNWSWFVNCNLR